jgi:hypothetical protein
MRLKPAQVKQICQKILVDLRTKQLVILKKTDAEVLAKMEELFTADLRIEDDINREAQKLLDQYAAQMGTNFDREKMFQLIKKQLIKDKKVVI